VTGADLVGKGEIGTVLFSPLLILRYARNRTVPFIFLRYARNRTVPFIFLYLPAITAGFSF